MQNSIQEVYEYLVSFFSTILPDFESSKIESIVVPLFSAIVTTIFTIAVFFVCRFFIRRIRRGINNWKMSEALACKYQGYQIITEEQSVQITLKIYDLFATIIYLILIYVYLNFIFYLFPVTHGLATRLFDYGANVVGFVVGGIIAYIPNIIILFIIYVIAKYALSFFKLFFQSIQTGRVKIKGFDQDWASPTFTLVRILVVAFTVIMMFPYLPGSGSPAFQGVSIFLGVLFSLGGSGTIANLISGIVLTYTRAFKVGDRVKVSGTIGDVYDKSVFVTRIMTQKNRIVTIPNSLLLNDHIINYSTLERENGLILETDVTIGYDAPFEKVEKCLIEAALATEGVEKNPEPFVLQKALEDYYVRYELNVYCNDSKAMNQIYSRLHRNIQIHFHSAGIEIASPGLTAVRDGNKINMPDEFISKDYEAPPFRFVNLPLDHLLNKKKD